MSLPFTHGEVNEAFEVFFQQSLDAFWVRQAAWIDPRQGEVDRRVETETTGESPLKPIYRSLVVVGEHEKRVEFDVADLVYVHDEKPRLLLRCSSSRVSSWKSGGFVMGGRGKYLLHCVWA
jgi:hypothetical protein